MTIRTLALITTATLLAACSGATEAAKSETAKLETKAAEVVSKVAGDVAPKGADLCR